jgi:hypothetical protein
MFVITKYKNKFLCITGSSMFLSFLYYLKYSRKNIHENVLGGSLMTTFVCSEIFWYNPIRFDIIHRIDGFVAKTSISYFIVYTLTCKELEYLYYYSYLCIMFGIFSSFYLSNRESSKEWCSDKHIMYHSLLHFFCFIGSLYAFF